MSGYYSRRVVVLTPVKPGPILVKVEKDARTMDEVAAANYARRELRKGYVWEAEADADLKAGCKALELTHEAVYVRRGGMSFWQDAGESGTGYEPLPTVGELVYKTAAKTDRHGFYDGPQDEPFIDEQAVLASAKAAIRCGVDQAERNAVKARAWDELAPSIAYEADSLCDPEALVHLFGRTLPAAEYPDVTAALEMEVAHLRMPAFDPFDERKSA